MMNTQHCNLIIARLDGAILSVGSEKDAPVKPGHDEHSTL